MEQPVETLAKTEEKIEKGIETVQENLADAGELLKTVSSDLKQDVEDVWVGTSQKIQENPLFSVGIAFAVGIGLGSLLTAWVRRD